ncbi:MAG TPA: hypothetical protein VN154_12675, partial [Rhizomicrobium sp.]|nr:hypothetical protein [Rhizomicrobium sp.]
IPVQKMLLRKVCGGAAARQRLVHRPAPDRLSPGGASQIAGKIRNRDGEREAESLCNSPRGRIAVAKLLLALPAE